MKVKYGLLSTARIGRNFHYPASLETSNAKIVAISSRNLETGQKHAKELGITKA